MKALPRLYAIADADVANQAGWTLLDLASSYLAAGASLLQVRAKHLPSGELLRLSTEISHRAHAAHAQVIVNDRPDIARLSAADGVHLGQDDLMPAAARAIVGAGALVGFSTHTHLQIDAAVHEPVSYIAIGPVFGTATKSTGYEAVGLDMVRDAAQRAHARGLPLVAIGGITLETAAAVLAAGADSIAVIGDLLATGDPEARVRAYLRV